MRVCARHLQRSPLSLCVNELSNAAEDPGTLASCRAVEMMVADKKVTTDKVFTAISVTAEKWVSLLLIARNRMHLVFTYMR